ncbi:RloB family protein [Herbivorax sp. ANBcel31]|uniref:RloB family protein n=1 Tax=Herbivorax sp. ANBcel31 TaxID=3069754 RepID=UPI0027B0DB5B|nr:RloB family protein [Herbivorax sp. ANBcel31]MDQ2087758.1 RloB family protein [Herbivorax sp. ANBcel31]
MLKKKTKKYYFSVEGETEKWYFDWLQEKINSEPDAKCKVNIEKEKCKNPKSWVKKLKIFSKISITNVFDYEGNDKEHVENFKRTLKLMKEASQLGKQIKYNLGYSNFTFELWMILHKIDFNKPLSNRDQYLQYINSAYNQSFKSLITVRQDQ